MQSPQPNEPAAERVRQIDLLLAQFVRAPSIRDETADERLVAQHPELAPELAEKLAALRRIQAAQREAAARAETYLTRRSPIEQVIDDELEVLREALPQFEFIDRVRYGGQGAVYRARQRATRRVVAIKVLLDGPLASEQQRARFEIEAQLTSQMLHPNIVTLFDYGVVRARPYQVLEFIEGLPIDDFALLNDLQPREIVALFLSVLDAVTAAHQVGIIHRDLNPANILVDARGAPHLLDFGLAKQTNPGPDEATTQTGHIVGTLPYLSPEQAGGLGGRVDVRSDVYALGVVLFQLLSEGFPYPVRGEWPDVRNRIVQQEPLLLRAAIAEFSPGRWKTAAVNRDLELVVRRALAKRREDRYQSVQALRDDLERYLRNEAVSARTGSRLYAARKFLSKHRVPVGVAAGLLLALTGATIVTTRALWIAQTQRDRARDATGISLELFSRSMAVDDELLQTAGQIGLHEEMLTGFEPLVEPLMKLAPETILPAVMISRHAELALQKGDRAESIRLFREVVEWCKEHESDRPNEITAPLVLHAHRRLVEARDPCARPQQQIAFAERVLSEHPQIAEIRTAAIDLIYAAGEDDYQAGRYETSLKEFERTLDLLGAPDPKLMRNAPLFACCRGRLTDLRKRLGLASDVLNERHQTVQFCKEMCTARPANLLARLQMLRALHSLGWEEFSLHRREDARVNLRSAIEAGSWISQLDSTSVSWIPDLISTYLDLGFLLQDMGIVDDANKSYAASLELAFQFDEHERGSARSATLLASCYHRLGLARVAAQQFLSARESLDLAAWNISRAAMLEPSPRTWQFVAEIMASEARLAWHLGDFEQFNRGFSEVTEIRRTLFAANPQSPEFVLQLAGTAVDYSHDLLGLNRRDADRVAQRVLRDAQQPFLDAIDCNPIIAQRATARDQQTSLANNLRVATSRLN